jgi:hypothetical protein
MIRRLGVGVDHRTRPERPCCESGVADGDRVVLLRVAASLFHGVRRRVPEDGAGDAAVQGIALNDLVSPSRTGSKRRNDQCGHGDRATERATPPHGPNSLLTAEPLPPPPEEELPPLELGAAEATSNS